MSEMDIIMSNQVDYIWTPGKVSMAHAKTSCRMHVINMLMVDYFC